MSGPTYPQLGPVHHPRWSLAQMAKTAKVSGCPTAMTAAATGMSTTRLLAGTAYAQDAGVPPSAWSRGNALERKLAEFDHAPMIALVREHLDFDLTSVVVENLRVGYPLNRNGLARRAAATRRLVARWVAGDPDAPNVIDGAVLTYEIGGQTHYAEVDAAGMQVGDHLHVIEIKSHPLVDGVLLGGAKTAWKLQMGTYVLLLRRLVAELGGDPAMVSARGLLVLARNMTIQPVGMPLDLDDDVTLAEITLDRVATYDGAAALAALDPALWPAALPEVPELGEDPDPDEVAAHEAAAAGRLAGVTALIDALGHDFGPACMDACELYPVCRARNAGQVRTLDRRLAAAAGPLGSFAAVAAAADDPSTAPEAAAGLAQRLSQAARLQALAHRLEEAG